MYFLLYRGGVVKHLRHFRGDANIRFRRREEKGERKGSVVNRYSNDLFRCQRSSTSNHFGFSSPIYHARQTPRNAILNWEGFFSSSFGFGKSNMHPLPMGCHWANGKRIREKSLVSLGMLAAAAYILHANRNTCTRSEPEKTILSTANRNIHRLAFVSRAAAKKKQQRQPEPERFANQSQPNPEAKGANKFW